MTERTAGELEREIYELALELQEVRKQDTGQEVANYHFDTLDGSVTLKDLFAGKERMLAIHNMGQACRYCTVWGDGINPFLPHLESELAVVLLSKDPPEVQRRFANSRNWRFRMVSHGGGEYMTEQTAQDGAINFPGIVCYELKDDKVYRCSSSVFGPGDLYCSMWHLLGVAGLDPEAFTPQYDYWQRPDKLDDGGENVL